MIIEFIINHYPLHSTQIVGFIMHNDFYFHQHGQTTYCKIIERYKILITYKQI